MIGFVIFVVLTFYIPSKLSEMFGGKLKPYGFLRATFAGVFAWITIFILANLFNLDFNYLGLNAEASKFKVSTLPKFLMASLVVAVCAFILDLLFLYGAKFLDWLWEKLSDVFPKKK